VLVQSKLFLLLVVTAQFWAVSSPFGHDYKQYLSLEEVADLLHPLPPLGSSEELDAEYVIKFLASQEGLLARSVPEAVTMTRTRDLVTAVLVATKAEELFGTSLYHFVPADQETFGLTDLVRASGPYTLPEELASKVSHVDKLLRLPRLAAAKSGWPCYDGQDGASCTNETAAGGDPEFDSCSKMAPTCKGGTTPAVLRKRYGFPELKNFTKGNSMGCTEFQLQGIKQKDLDAFGSACGVETVKVDRMKGPGGRLVAGVEALLDVEYIEAVGAPIPLTVINSVSYSLFDWASQLNNDKTPAWVQSVSYGNDEVQQTSLEYMFDCNTQFMIAGARGLSVLFASGDQGVWGRSGAGKDGVFHPDFPASSPYITAVGGTDFLKVSTIGDEKAWANGGGGFSNTFARPSYQEQAVAGYLQSDIDMPIQSQFNSTGRAYPDVAALAGIANGYCVAAKGKFMKVGGTSASCPVFAGSIALINDALLARGLGPMGFLNPWIYGVAGPFGGFFDVTTGTNSAGFGAGFTATEGWDPATGFGSPNFPAMLSLALFSDPSAGAAH